MSNERFTPPRPHSVAIRQVSPLRHGLLRLIFVRLLEASFRDPWLRKEVRIHRGETSSFSSSRRRSIYTSYASAAAAVHRLFLCRVTTFFTASITRSTSEPVILECNCRAT